jgi:hypothetical protein
MTKINGMQDDTNGEAGDRKMARERKRDIKYLRFCGRIVVKEVESIGSKHPRSVSNRMPKIR